MARYSSEDELIPLSNLTILGNGLFEVKRDEHIFNIVNVSNIKSYWELARDKNQPYVLLTWGEGGTLSIDTSMNEFRLFLRKVCGFSDEELGLEALRCV